MIMVFKRGRGFDFEVEIEVEVKDFLKTIWEKGALVFGAAPPPPRRTCRVSDGGLFTARSIVGGV